MSQPPLAFILIFHSVCQAHLISILGFNIIYLTVQNNLCVAEEELYQNYQEKALHNDSDEDADAREPKPDSGIVVQYRPIRTSWSQLTVVRHYSHIPLNLVLHSRCKQISCIHSLWTLSVTVCGASECLCSEECCHIQFGHSPYPSSHFLCPSCCLSGSTGAFLLVLGWAGGRQSARPSESLASTAGPNAIVLASSTYSSDWKYAQNVASKVKCGGLALHNVVRDLNGEIVGCRGSEWDN